MNDYDLSIFKELYPPIITSLLENDLYKFSMAQAVLHHYPGAWVRYAFKNRSHAKFPVLGVNQSAFIEEFDRQLSHLCSLQFSNEELSYLSKIRYFKIDFIEYLRLLKLNKNYVKYWWDSVDGDTMFNLEIEGPFISTIWFEVPILAIISELYYNLSNQDEKEAIENRGLAKLKEEVENFKSVTTSATGFKMSDFGLRRRFSKSYQYSVVKYLKENFGNNFTGTSNVYLAKEFNLIPVGTMAHEFIMAHQQLGPRLIDSQKAALDCWVHEYRGDLGIALSDTLGFDAFLRDFDLYFCKLYDGCRHDSGNPYLWGDKLIEHYMYHRIDPAQKTAVFSDGLTLASARELYNYFHGKINTAFGIGTWLTNPLEHPLQLVIKLTECNGRPVAKLSDSPGKQMCEDESYLTYLKDVFKKEE